MKIHGDHTFDAPRDMVWTALMDPEVIGKIMPGCDDLNQLAENTYEGAMKIKVGPVQGKFKGKVELSDLKEPESYHINIDGKGAPGFLNGAGTLRLSEAEGDKTMLHYEIDAKVGGRIASVGQRLLDSSARVITRQAFEGLDQHIAHRVALASGAASSGATAASPDAATDAASKATATASAPRPAPAASPPPPEAPSQARFAAEFARGMVEELIPPERRPLAAAIGGGVFVALILLLFRACG